MEATIQKTVNVKDLLSVHGKFSVIKRTEIVQELQGVHECRFNRVTAYYFLGIPVYRKAFFYS